jgi:predicted ArsR family transcriptional regulator
VRRAERGIIHTPPGNNRSVQKSTPQFPLNQRIIQQIGRSQRLKIINELKRTQGLPVRDLADRLGMSYMGVKDMCVDLERRGFLDTWRQPQKIGRPLMLYRLTQRAHGLFPAASNPMTIELLEAAQKLFGPAAPEKLLLLVFQRKAEDYGARLKGDTVEERAKWLARLRDHEGYMSGCETAIGEIRIIEHHSPILDLLRAFPLVARLETDLFARLLRTGVRREEHSASGLFCATFFCGPVSE